MAKNRIQIDGGEGAYVKEEAIADGAVSPGMLVELTSAGKVKAHATEGGYALCAVAVEDALQGDTVDDDYADGDLVTYHIQRRGTRFQGLVKAGSTIVKGTILCSDGDGTWIPYGDSGSTVNQVLAEAEEAKTLTGSYNENTLLMLRAL